MSEREPSRDPASEPTPAEAEAEAEPEAAVAGERAPTSSEAPGLPPATPKRSGLGGCLKIVAGGFILFLIGGGLFFATWRPFPPLPPTGLLTAKATSAVLALDSGVAATIPVHLSVASAQPKDRGTTVWARPRMTATVTGATGDGVTIAVETPDGGPVVADSNASASTGLLTWDDPCPDASACVLDYLVVVANTTDVSATATIRFDARLEFPLSVPAPDGAALTVAVDPVGEPDATVAAATAGESAVEVDPAAAPILRRVALHVPRADPGAAATWLVLDALLAETDPGPDPSRLAVGSTGGPIGKVTIDGIGDGPIVRDLVGEPHHVVLGPIAACSAGCELDLSVTFESLEVRPGVGLRLDWSARVATVTRRGSGPSPAAVAVSLSTLESSPVAKETASGDIRITRKVASGGVSIVLRLDAPSPAAGSSTTTRAGVFDRALTGTATVDLSVEVTGSTRRVVIPVNITSPNAMRFPGSGVTVVSGATTRLLATPFQTCSQPLTCEEGISIRAQLSGPLVSILSDDETVVVHWTVGVSVSRIGPAAAPAGEPPTLTITSTTSS